MVEKSASLCTIMPIWLSVYGFLFCFVRVWHSRAISTRDPRVNSVLVGSVACMYEQNWFAGVSWREWSQYEWDNLE